MNPAVAVPKRASYEDILALPSHVVGEIVGGELIVSPRPAPAHAESASALGMLLGAPFRFGSGGPGGWWIEFEPELHFGAHPHLDILVPDIAGWRRERMPHLPETAYFTMAPDWVAEVLSPGTAAVDRTEKLPIYARVGVGHVWLIDPLVFTLEVYRRTEERWTLVGAWRDVSKVRAEPFEAFELDLALLWER